MPSFYKSLFVLLLVACVGCRTEQEREYRTLAVTFFRMPLKKQMEEFSRYDVEKQYVVFICGNQYIHPPATYLAGPFAMEGEKVVSFLTEKLQSADDDQTVRDIILVFAEMSRRKTYEVGANKDLMGILTNRVAQMKDPEWRRVVEGQMMTDITGKP